MNKLEVVLASRYESLQAELLEQCRLNGMGAEREANLMGEVERLKADNERLKRFANQADTMAKEVRAEAERLKTQLSGQTCYVPPEFQNEMDALRAKLDEAAKQEPVAWMFHNRGNDRYEAARPHWPDAFPVFTKPQPAAIPEGYKLVPIEPMSRQNEGIAKIEHQLAVVTSELRKTQPRLDYRVMHSTAPKPQGV